MDEKHHSKDSPESPSQTPPWAKQINGRTEQLFPELNQEQLTIISRFGNQQCYTTGDFLWRTGERHINFFVIVEGELDIVRQSPIDGEHLVVRHGPGVFSGEIASLSGRAALVAGRAASNLTVLAITPENLRELVSQHSQLSEIILRAFILRRMKLLAENLSGIVLIGSRYSHDTLRLQSFLTRNAMPNTYLDIEQNNDISDLLDRFDVAPSDVPIIILDDGRTLKSPSIANLADAMGISPELKHEALYDLAVIGAGPAGLAAAVYAASEGLKVLVLEPTAPGGQAGTSSKIENYLGFPTGISGQALAGRAFTQAQKFGAEIAIPRQIVSLTCGDPFHTLTTDANETINARSVVIASGAKYRKPQLPDLDRFEGNGVYYGATFVEARLCKQQEVVIVGGGNSAGQAAVYLSELARKVYILVRSEGLAASMSHYLVHRIDTTENIELLPHTQITQLEGEEHLEYIHWQTQKTGESAGAIHTIQNRRPIRHLFLFIGAQPNTEFLDGRVILDDKGFIRTGFDGNHENWPLARPPYLLETSCPRLFAAGDVRSGSTKRVASAVGEGSVVVQFIHQVLLEK